MKKLKAPKKLSEITAKRKTALALIQAIKDKVKSLKYGYIADDELKALENLVSSIK